jgi:hypothetical protein
LINIPATRLCHKYWSLAKAAVLFFIIQCVAAVKAADSKGTCSNNPNKVKKTVFFALPLL